MEKPLICLDTSILIDFFRKTAKETTIFYRLAQNYSLFAVSAVTEYEVFSGSNTVQQSFWEQVFNGMVVLPFSSDVAKEAATIYQTLRKNGQLIDVPDVFIAATAIVHQLPLATINKKHFERIQGIQLLHLPL